MEHRRMLTDPTAVLGPPHQPQAHLSRNPSSTRGRFPSTPRLLSFSAPRSLTQHAPTVPQLPPQSLARLSLPKNPCRRHLRLLFRRVPADLTGAQPRSELPCLRPSLPSGQIRLSRPRELIPNPFIYLRISISRPFFFHVCLSPVQEEKRKATATGTTDQGVSLARPRLLQVQGCRGREDGARQSGDQADRQRRLQAGHLRQAQRRAAEEGAGARRALRRRPRRPRLRRRLQAVRLLQPPHQERPGAVPRRPGPPSRQQPDGVRPHPGFLSCSARGYCLG